MYTHTHTPLPSVRKSLLNRFLSLSSPTLHMCKKTFAAEVLLLQNSHMYPKACQPPWLHGRKQYAVIEILHVSTWQLICQNLWFLFLFFITPPRFQCIFPQPLLLVCYIGVSLLFVYSNTTWGLLL